MNMNGSSIIYTDFGLYVEQQKSEHLMLLLKHIYIYIYNCMKWFPVECNGVLYTRNFKFLNYNGNCMYHLP